MNQRTFSVTAAAVFLIIAVGHLMRVLLGMAFVVGNAAVPMWASVLAVILMGYLAFQGFRLGRSPRAGG
jgi:hypothetical protein